MSGVQQLSQLKEVDIHFIGFFPFSEIFTKPKNQQPKHLIILVLQFLEIFAMGKSLHITPFQDPGGVQEV